MDLLAVFIDLILLTLLIFILMIGLSFYLRWERRSRRFLVYVWGFFLLVQFIGIMCCVSTIQNVRQNQLDYFAQSAKSYANLASMFSDEQIHPGDPDLFSDWSDPVLPQRATSLSDPSAGRTPPTSPANEAVEKQLAIPQGLTAAVGPRTFPEEPNRIRRHTNHWAVVAILDDNTSYDQCPLQAVLHWEPVPGASTYRLQWACADGLEISTDEEWFDVYSGSRPCCVLDCPTVPLRFRVRAETGTPEDDPVYLNLMRTCDNAVFSNPYLGFVYLIEYGDKAEWVYIVGPGNDANHNGRIDTKERASTIGESCPLPDGLSEKLRHDRDRVLVSPISADEWGVWCTAFAPIAQSKEGTYRYIGLDFHAAILLESINASKFWPYCFFCAVNLGFFGGVIFIARLQNAKEMTREYADRLQNMVADLTEAKILAESAVEAKTRFLTNMSHEIRTPMNAVLGFSDLFGRQLMPYCPREKQPQCRFLYQSIVRNANDLLALITNILDFSASGVRATKQQLQGQPELICIDFTKFMLEMHEWMKARLADKPIEMEFRPEGDVPAYIVTDLPILSQILKSLLDNAVKFTDHGSIRITYRADMPDETDTSGSAILSDSKMLRPPKLRKTPEPTVASPPRIRMIRFEIADTGIGIAKKDMQRVFQPFSQAEGSLVRRHGGIGLGLSLAKQLADLLAGTITVQSRLGEGSTFTLSLPAEIQELEEVLLDGDEQADQDETESEEAADDQNENGVASEPEQAEAASDPVEPATKPLAGRRVLIVEDIKINQIVISSQLVEAGAEISVADNGQIGVDKAVEAEKNDPFDVILMDMQMPVMDGYTATTTLRNKGYTRPIIAVTAHALSEDRQKTLDAGCDDYLTKPVSADRLIETIEMYLF